LAEVVAERPILRKPEAIVWNGKLKEAIIISAFAREST